LDPEDAIELNSRVWAPMWIKRGSKKDVKNMQEKGMKVFIWTVDKPSRVKQYVTESGYDGVLIQLSISCCFLSLYTPIKSIL
jgi:glycerophosphoryl diester phosphodiesterase